VAADGREHEVDTIMNELPVRQIAAADV